MDLISKKDLLAQTGISYGQLYRWKRERLIPEEWFIKRASYTGQETYFPKDQMLERIDSITTLKDEYSLEEMARIFTAEVSTSISETELRSIKEVDEAIVDVIAQATEKERYTLLETAFVVAISQAAADAKLSDGQKIDLAKDAAPVAFEEKSTDTTAIFFMAADECHTVFMRKETLASFDNGVDIVLAKPISDVVGALKHNYKNLFGN